MSKQRNSRPGWTMIAVAVLLLSSGCQATSTSVATNPFKAFSNSKVEEIEYKSPQRMAVIWKESSMAKGNDKATRGFGGRLYFYDEENETVRVDGQLTVYAYDDSNTNNDQSRVPDRKFVFHAEDLQRHHSRTGLGESYSIWLPWDKVGGDRKTIALVPVFRPKEGRVPMTDHSIAVLTGPTPGLDEEEMEEIVSGVRHASATVPSGEAIDASLIGTGMEDAVKSTVRTSTFQLTRSLSNRVKLAPKSTATKPVDQVPLGNAANPNAANPNVAKPIAVDVAGRAIRTPKPAEASQDSGQAERSVGTRPQRNFGKPGAFH